MRVTLGRLLLGLLPVALCCSPIVRAQQPPIIPPPVYGSATHGTWDYSRIQGQFAGYAQEAAPQAVAPVEPLCCADGVGTWYENTVLALGVESFKCVGDFFPPLGADAGFMNSAGMVGGFNTGFSIGLENVRGQIGASYGVYDWRGRDSADSQNAAEQQTFLTAGFYKRSDVRWGDRLCWGLVYDQFWAHQWGMVAGELYVGQVRGLVGWAVDDWNELGMWGAFHTNTDSFVCQYPNPLRAMNQYNAYWRHNYDFGGQTMLYVGGCDGAAIASWLFGGLAMVPLNDSVALYGNFAFALPGSAAGPVGSNELLWNLGGGIAFFLGGKAVSPNISGRQGLPLLPVANNGFFLVTD